MSSPALLRRALTRFTDILRGAGEPVNYRGERMGRRRAAASDLAGSGDGMQPSVRHLGAARELVHGDSVGPGLPLCSSTTAGGSEANACGRARRGQAPGDRRRAGGWPARADRARPGAGGRTRGAAGPHARRRGRWPRAPGAARGLRDRRRPPWWRRPACCFGSTPPARWSSARRLRVSSDRRWAAPGLLDGTALVICVTDAERVPRSHRQGLGVRVRGSRPLSGAWDGTAHRWSNHGI